MTCSFYRPQLGPSAGLFHHIAAPQMAASTKQTTRLSDLIFSSAFGPSYGQVCSEASVVCHAPTLTPEWHIYAVQKAHATAF